MWLIAASLVSSLGLVEIALRALIGLGVPILRRPGLYADAQSEDEYWKLWHRWWTPAADAPRVGVLDPDLGWAPALSPGDPLGVADHDCARLGKPNAVLFYGDSFVAGTGSCEHSVPHELGERLPDHAVYNLGVGGYGVDQSYLRLVQTVDRVPASAVLFGILTVDLDRSVLSVRTGPKPYFAVDGDRLVLHRLPPGIDVEEWYRRNPPRIPSYALALIRQQLRLAVAGRDWLAVRGRQAEKEQVNARILEEVVQAARDRRLPLLFVLFYSEPEVRRDGWREAFLKAQLGRLGAPYIDTKSLLRDGGDVSVYYAPDGHLNDGGNALVAAGIANALCRLFGADTRGCRS